MFSYPVPKAMFAVAILLLLPLAWLVVSQSGSKTGFNILVPAVPFFVAFGLFKGALGLDALMAMKHQGEKMALLSKLHGSDAEIKRWAIFKLTAMGVAFFAAVVCAGTAMSKLG